MADQYSRSIVPMTKYRFSKASLAPRRTCLDFQSAWASTKPMPCFALLLSLLCGSNSNGTESLLTHLRLRSDHLSSNRSTSLRPSSDFGVAGRARLSTMSILATTLRVNLEPLTHASLPYHKRLMMQRYLCIESLNCQRTKLYFP